MLIFVLTDSLASKSSSNLLQISFILQNMETTLKKHNQSKCRDQLIMVQLAPADIATAQFQQPSVDKLSERGQNNYSYQWTRTCCYLVSDRNDSDDDELI